MAREPRGAVLSVAWALGPVLRISVLHPVGLLQRLVGGSAATVTVKINALSELPKYNVIKYQSPASVATAIDDMADAIVTKATQKAKEAIENAACDNSQTKQQSALE